MQNQTLFLLFAALSPLTASAQETLEKRLESLEIEVNKHAFEFGAIFDSRYDLMRYTPEGGDEDKVNINRMLFSLNMSANLTPKLSLHGRLTMSKVFINYGS